MWWKWDQYVASNSTERKYFNQSVLFAYSSSLFHFYFSCLSLSSATSSQNWVLSLQGWRAVPTEHINLIHFHEYQWQAGCQQIFLISSRIKTQFYVQTLSQVKSGGVSSKAKPAISFSHSLHHADSSLLFFSVVSIYTMVIRKSHSPFCPWKAISTQALGQNLECRISAVQLPWSLSLSCVTRYCIFFSSSKTEI